jgi:phosphatidylglycerophosphate synthase
LGAVFIITGRLCDLIDGWLADRTGTKSPLGEAVDATADKLGTAATIIVLPLAGLMPIELAIALVVPQAAIAVMALFARRRGRGLHPSRWGKLSMAAATAALAAPSSRAIRPAGTC